MNHLTTYQELTDSRKLLEKLFEEVKTEEGTLAGGTRNNENAEVSGWIRKMIR